MKREEIKQIIKFSAGVFAVAFSIFSVYKIIQLIKKYDALSLLYGFDQLSRNEDTLVDISKAGTKFLSRKNDEGIEAFKAYLSSENYKFIGKFGRSDLYSIDGIEVIVRRTKLFNKYYLFEIFNEKYFEEKRQISQ